MVHKQFVKTMRADYNAIAPEYLNYVEQDGVLRDWERELRRDTVRSWDGAIQSMEKNPND